MPAAPANPQIDLRFDAPGGELFRALTGANPQNALAMVVAGRVVVMPTIQSAIGQEVRITGRFSEEEVAALVAGILGHRRPPAAGCTPPDPRTPAAR